VSPTTSISTAPGFSGTTTRRDSASTPTSRLPDTFGGQEISVRLFQNKDDDDRGINRTENLRAMPEGSEDFKRLSPLRPDAESINNEIERSLYIKRASGRGWRRQMVDLFALARLINAITLARCRPREGVEAA